MDEQQLQLQIVRLVREAMQGDQQAIQQIQRIMQAAQQGDQQAAQLALMIQTVAQQVRTAKFGAKLNYIRQLRGVCPDGYEMQYFKEGGTMGKPAKYCKRCVQKKMEEGGEVPSNPVDAFKCGRKMKRKAACGTKLPKDKCGSKVEMDKCGKKMKKVKKNQPGGEIESRYKGGFHNITKPRNMVLLNGYTGSLTEIFGPLEEVIIGTDDAWYGKRPSRMWLTINLMTNDSTVYETTPYIPNIKYDLGISNLGRWFTGLSQTPKEIKRTSEDWERAKAATKRK